MPALLVSKSPPLSGEVTIHGAKNSVLPILAATLLCRTPCVLHNCPDILDVTHALAILCSLGCAAERRGVSVDIDPRGCAGHSVPPELAASMRASSLFLGALLARQGEASLSLPGGCPIGARPVDYHLLAFRALGAEVTETDDTIHCRARRLTGAKITLPGPSVGATENAMLAAVGAEGVTVIENAACEPEIVDLAGFLTACGAKIAGAGKGRVIVEGSLPLTGATYTILPDRIETATFLCACAACGGALTLRRTDPRLADPVLNALTESGCRISCSHDTIQIFRDSPLATCGPVVSRPYPGFPTDAMPMLLSAQLCARGQTSFTETIFENRFGYVQELKKLGARLYSDGNTVCLNGTPQLHAAQLFAEDLRGGAALVLAAMQAEGESTIFGVKHIERGYDTLENALQSVGARLKTVEIPKKM